MFRKLGVFEKAMVIANNHAPFNIVCVLKMENAPAPKKAREALFTLQHRHPLLRARISFEEVEPNFQPIFSDQLEFQVIEDAGPEKWRKIATREMDTGFSQTSGPLFRAAYIHQERRAELILNIHHGIVDAVSVMNLLVEFLELCSGTAHDMYNLKAIPAMEENFPPAKKGLNGVSAATSYLLSQIQEMSRYLWQTRHQRKPPVRLGGSSHILTMTLPMEQVEELNYFGRKNRVTLNSTLNAAQLLAVNRVLYNAQPTTMRTYAFADMRPFTEPPTAPIHLGNFISMLGYTIKLEDHESFWTLTQDLHEKIYNSLKNGNKFGAILMSEMLLKTMTGLKTMRFGAAALNYNAEIPLKKQYGEIIVKGLHGFVSAYDLGPEFASQARLFDNKLWWDFCYLDTDMDAVTAQKILDEIKTILHQAVQVPALPGS